VPQPRHTGKPVFIFLEKNSLLSATAQALSKEIYFLKKILSSILILIPKYTHVTIHEKVTITATFVLQ
jgi:hypothetical protein